MIRACRRVIKSKQEYIRNPEKDSKEELSRRSDVLDRYPTPGILVMKVESSANSRTCMRNFLLGAVHRPTCLSGTNNSGLSSFTLLCPSESFRANR